jgi:hypothetical protein
MYRNRNIQFLRLTPENVVGAIAQSPMIVRIGTDKDDLEVQLGDDTANFPHGQIDILDRHRETS